MQLRQKETHSHRRGKTTRAAAGTAARRDLGGGISGSRRRGGVPCSAQRTQPRRSLQRGSVRGGISKHLCEAAPVPLGQRCHSGPCPPPCKAWHTHGLTHRQRRHGPRGTRVTDSSPGPELAKQLRSYLFHPFTLEFKKKTTSSCMITKSMCL